MYSRIRWVLVVFGLVLGAAQQLHTRLLAPMIGVLFPAACDVIAWRFCGRSRCCLVRAPGRCTQIVRRMMTTHHVAKRRLMLKP